MSRNARQTTEKIALMRRGLERYISVGGFPETYKKVDLVLKKDAAVVELIQVCFNLEDHDVRAREFKSLAKAGKGLKCPELRVITSETAGVEKFRRRAIQLVSLWQWLVEGNEPTP